MRPWKTAAAAATVLALTATGCSAAGNGSGSDGGDFAATGTIKMVVAMAAGGGSDRSARVIASMLNGNDDGYSTVVENREGGGGAIGWSYFYGLDGQPSNLLIAETALHTLPRQEGVELPFTYEDFTPIALFAEDSRVVVARADAPYDDCAELIEASRNSDVFTGISGTYGADGIVLEQLTQEGLDANRVPFGSSGEVVTSLLSGLIDFAPASAASVKSYVQNGDFKGLCSLAETPFDDEVMGSITTAKNQGLDASVTLWRGVLAPSDISDSARDFWIEQMRTALESDAYDEYLRTDMLLEKKLFGDDFAAYLDDYDVEIEGYFG